MIIFVDFAIFAFVLESNKHNTSEYSYSLSKNNVIIMPKKTHFNLWLLSPQLFTYYWYLLFMLKNICFSLSIYLLAFGFPIQTSKSVQIQWTPLGGLFMKDAAQKKEKAGADLHVVP